MMHPKLSHTKTRLRKKKIQKEQYYKRRRKNKTETLTVKLDHAIKLYKDLFLGQKNIKY